MKSKERKLLFSLSKEKGDFVVQTFRSGGKGGQNQNKRDTGVRIVHPASGARGESRNCRTQGQNKKAAFRRLIESDTFKTWHRIQCSIISGRLDQWLEEQMKPENILVETRRNGKWVKE